MTNRKLSVVEAQMLRLDAVSKGATFEAVAKKWGVSLPTLRNVIRCRGAYSEDADIAREFRDGREKVGLYCLSFGLRPKWYEYKKSRHVWHKAVWPVLFLTRQAAQRHLRQTPVFREPKAGVPGRCLGSSSVEKVYVKRSKAIRLLQKAAHLRGFYSNLLA